ncbi:Hypothetical predicted protein [Cloeon dipterum]|uniref:Uncharacterized protein n=1 Tax=Cloeon dipterum TaxID=197152 RepID=A0A8S1DVQ4_9INSE|nr:Hypothetical predicted protein [Cloeon dipterum]
MGSATVLLLCQLLVAVVWSQSVITDAGPDEFPYVVKIYLNFSSYLYTEVGVVVGKRYILASKDITGALPANVTVTDQSGKVRPVVRVKSIASNKFTYVKVCENFEGAKMPMTASSFNDLSADVNSTGFLLFFNASSHVLRKLPASAMKTASCTNAAGGNYFCTYKDSSPGYCSFIMDPTFLFVNVPVMAIGNQVQGNLDSPGCNFLTGDANVVWSQSVITDAGPDEFPYVVKIYRNRSNSVYTEAGVVVGKRYILATKVLNGNLPALLTVTDQSGKVRPVVKVQSIASNKFTYVKVCENFEGAKMPMTASSFNDLSADVNSTGFLLSFNATSVSFTFLH